MHITDSHDLSAQGVRMSITEQGRTYWRSRAFIPDSVRESIAHADILAVPLEGFRDHSDPVFPTGTEDLIEAMRLHAGSEFAVDICIGEDNYQELALHGLMLQLGQWFLTAIAAPVVANALWAYIQKQRGRSAAKDDTVRVRLLVQRSSSDMETVVQIEYEGAADQFHAVMAPLADRIAHGEALPEFGKGEESSD